MNLYESYLLNRHDNDFRDDRQQDAPIAYCPICGGEIYRRFDAEEIDGTLYHSECLESIYDGV